MNRTPEERLEEVFAAAAALPETERAEFLDGACLDEPELRREVEELLAASGESFRFFEELSRDISSAAELELEDAAQPRVEIGAYRTVQVIGQGGMGAVYRAERADGAFDQEVALKLLHLDMQTPELRARFFAERQILARLNHPKIARLVDGGVTEEGRPYFAMEFVDGQPITRYCRERQLSVAEILRLFLDIVDAVAYLHRNLIVHRDLKPSNLFVDREGRVKLLDFGIAKLLADEPEVARTVTGDRLLTPQYAAPEQLLDRSVTTATDVYALGVVLYELLCGSRPYEGMLAELAQPERSTARAPSAVLRARLKGEVAGDEPASPIPPSHWRRVAGDLDTICLKALRPEPDRRYLSASEMGLDVERHLDGLPVRARRSTLGYRLRKFAERNKTGVAAALLLMMLLGFGLARERGLRRASQAEAAKASAVVAFLGDLISSADPAQAQGEEVTVIEVLKRSEEALRDRAPGLPSQPNVEAAIRMVLGRTYTGLGKFEEAEVHLRRALELAGGLESGDPTAMEAAEALADNLSLEAEQRLPILRRVLAVRQQSLGPNHEKTLSVQVVLTRVLRFERRFEEAEKLAKEVLERSVTALGRDHSISLRAMNSLAGVFFERARYAEAAELYTEALAVAEESLGPSHPQTLRLVGNLGASYSALGRYLEAEPLQRRVLQERLRVLGELHYQSGFSMHNLGVVLSRLGRFQEAADWLQRAVVARATAAPAGYLYSKTLLANALRDQGKLAAAEAVYFETLEEQRRLLDPDHPDPHNTRAGLAGLRLRQGEVEEARELALQALEGQRLHGGDKGLEAAETLLLLAEIALHEDDLESALTWAESAAAMRRGVYAEDHPMVLEAELVRARILYRLEETEATRAQLDGVCAALVAALGPRHFEVERCRQLAGQVGSAT